MAKTTATWYVSLDCHCPACGEYVDLLDHPDFWDGHQGLEVPEHSTAKSRDVDVYCPRCDHNFTVDLEY